MSIALVACEEDEQATLAAYPAEVERALDGIEFARAPGHSLDVLQERVDVAVDAMYDVANHAETWQDAHARAQEHIRAAPPGVIRTTVEQSMAKLMTVGYLTPHQEESGVADLALDYTRLLVKHGSPEAEAVLETVQAFAPAWGVEEVRTLSVAAADAVEAHVAGGAPCEDCALTDEVRRSLVESGKSPDVISLRRLDAAGELRALAD